MAKQHQISAEYFTTILDIQRGTYSRGWSCLERHKNCFSKQEAWSFFWRSSMSHLGLNKCKLHPKDTVYWPGYNEQLERLILNCKLCLKYSQSKHRQQPSLSLGKEIPLHPWTKLVTDIFHFEGASYLLIVDYTSRFPVCTSYHPWQDSVLQVSASWYFLSMVGQTLWFLTIDHATLQKLLQAW